MIEQYAERIHLANLPTPIVKLNKITELWGGPEIYLKRDDLTGMGLSGNKIRKLEFVLADAQKKGANLVITCGGIQSNHARATAIAATKLGMKSCLVLRGKADNPIEGNLFIDLMVGAEIRNVTPEEYTNKITEIMEETAEDYRRKGYKPYIIPEGASNKIGTLGYIAGVEEFAEQLTKQNLEIDFVINAVGSGGTYAGLLLGQKMLNEQFEIIGFNVCDDEAYFVEKINRISNEAIEHFGLPVSVKKTDIKIIDGYVGEGYALSRKEELDLIKEVAMAEGIILDPVYTGKAMYGFRDQIRKGRFTKRQKVLFIHTGGLFGIFPKQQLFFQ